MSEMIERAIAAIWDHNRVGAMPRDEVEWIVRRVIEAMREPTDAMIGLHHRPTAELLWRSMISTALNPTTEQSSE
jgi:hypothetical protein